MKKLVIYLLGMLASGWRAKEKEYKHNMRSVETNFETIQG